jgi:prolyl oligopeptidase
MKKLVAFALPALVLGSACRSAVPSRVYPAAPRAEVVDEYHGESVADPFRPLEDPDAPATRAWIEAENALTAEYLADIPARDALRRRLSELYDVERFELPVQQGGRIFFRKNDGLQNQAVLFVAERVDATPRMLLDPNALSQDGTVALMSFVPSPDGRWLAYSLSDGGSDWRLWRVRSVESGLDLPDELTRNKFGSLAWAVDGSGLFYTRYDQPPPGAALQAKNAPPDVCFHRLGTEESDDALIARRPAQEGRTQSFTLAEDGLALFQVVQDVASRTNELYRVPLLLADGQWRAGEPEALVQGFDSRSVPIGDLGDTLFLRTDLGAPRGRIVALDRGAPARERWRELVPEASETIQAADEAGGMLLVQYLKDARSLVRVFGADGVPRGEVDLPGLGTAAGFSGDREDGEVFYSFTSATRPAAIYRFELASQKSTLYRESKLSFSPDDYETEQVFYASHDGTRVPMFLTHRRGLAHDGRAPTLLYGYGGFGISLTPTFSVQNLAWLELGGLLAIPNLRGGGEYGEDWHAAGTKLHKQNVFDDFIGAAEWLIANGWTRPARLAIHGRSNGGLLVGACLTQRPELFGAALAAVGVLDMLRYHRFTIGWAWAGDYGTSDDPAQFTALRRYSPLHNVARGRAYPATLVTTADHDDRVVPAHSFKFTAALQAAQAGPEPILIRVDTRAGHGAGKPTAMLIEEWADCLAFLVRELGME